MLGSGSLFPSLGANEGKRLKLQLKEYLRDYPDGSVESLAEIWHDEQEVLAEGTWLEAYVQGQAWRREVPRALTMLRREAQQKVKAKELRGVAKERRQDREPATDAQKRYLGKLTKKRPEMLPGPLDGLSKLAASRLIKQALES